MRKFIFIFLLVLLFSCGQSEKTKPEVQGKFHSFKQVPGITAEEISAIESLQSKSKYFVYGMPLSVEAFEDFDGNIRGFTALFCEWLTELFEIPFYPQLFDWLDLLHGLETGDIHFTGELTANEERQKIYHMTTDIASRALKYFRLINSRPMEDIMKERRIRCGFIEG
ncbi:MAG: histidine kinase, partial [Treponema sp.]|nr:histidine kinase [Treponema sp.]MCL2237453.1 histidine kinase [Treponema sp.]